MNAPNSGKMEGTIYEMPPAMLATSQGLAQEVRTPMRPHDTANRVVRIPLHSRKYPDLYALVDEADAELVSGYRWYPKPGRGNTFYAIAFPDGRAMYMHRLLIANAGEMMVDHVDHDGLNNRRCNLRLTTHRQNLQNRKRKGASAYIGVSWDRPANKWRADIGMHGKVVHLGRFATEIDAARAYDRAAIEHCGESASLNFPDRIDEYVNDRREG